MDTGYLHGQQLLRLKQMVQIGFGIDAVGLASVKVAENFNSMALGLVSGDNPLWLNALLSVGTVLILVAGHALNLAMAALSILVHAVRLNTLEFSNHKGVSWAGYAFSPFQTNKETEKCSDFLTHLNIITFTLSAQLIRSVSLRLKTKTESI